MAIKEKIANNYIKLWQRNELNEGKKNKCR